MSSLPDKPFQPSIGIIDPSNDFIPYYDTYLKEFSNSYHCTISLREYIESPYILNLPEISEISLNITEINPLFFTTSYKDPLPLETFFTINVLRLLKDKELHSDKTKLFKENANNQTQLLILLINTTDCSDSSLKSCNKICDKLKKELNCQDIIMLPFISKGNLSNHIIDSFYKAYKDKIELFYMRKLMQLFTFLQNKEDGNKDILSNEDKMIEYIQHKALYHNYLFTIKAHKAIVSSVSDDLFKTFKSLNKQYQFTAYMTFDNKLFMNKLCTKTITNLDYQEYLIYTMLSAFSLISNSNEGTVLNFYNTMVSELSQYTNCFKSMFHFYFWSYLFIGDLLISVKSHKQMDATPHEEEINYKSQLSLLYFMKKTLKYYALSAKIDIPCENIFTLALQYKHSSEISNEMNSALNSINEEIESNITYTSFISEIKTNFDKHMNGIFIYQAKFFEEYLFILKNLNKIHTDLNQQSLSLRVLIESIPIYFALSKFEEVKKTIIQCMNVLESKPVIKWKYIYEYLIFSLVILINCLDCSYDNLQLVLKCVGIKISNVDKLIKTVNSNEKNLIEDLISTYIERFDVDLKENKAEFDMKRIIDIEFVKTYISFNINEGKEFEMEFKLKNKSGFWFKVEKVVFEFEEVFKKENAVVEIKGVVDKIEKYSEVIEYQWKSGTIGNVLKSNCVYVLNKIRFVIKNNIEGVYKLAEVDNPLTVNIKELNTNVQVQLLPSYKTRQLENTVLFPNANENFFFNTLHLLHIQMSNLPSDMNDKYITIELLDSIRDNEDVSELKFAHHLLGEIYNNKVNDNVIDLTKEKVVIKGNTINEMLNDKGEIDIPFLIEDINYYVNNLTKNIQVIFSIFQNDNKLLYSFSYASDINLIHLFSLNEKFRMINQNIYLMQTTFNLNLDYGGSIKLYMQNTSKNTLILDITQSYNTVLQLTNNNPSSLTKTLSSHNIVFSIGKETNIYHLCYPMNHILSEITELTKLPFYINITTDNVEHKIFEEFIVNVSIKKYTSYECLLMLKVKESENWSIIGKSKVIERLSKGEQSITVSFKLFPLLDGYLRLPEIEFMEYEINEGENDEKGKVKDIDLLNMNYLAFERIKFESVIEGNERIVKINSINSCSLHLNLT